MNVLILGGTGMLGHKAAQVFAPRFETWASVRHSRAQCARWPFLDPARTIFDADITSGADVQQIIDAAQPDVVLNCIGILKRPYSPEHAVNTVTCNALLPHWIEAVTVPRGLRLIQISTDCVYSGNKGMYVEADAADADDLYGRSKLLGEVAGDNCLTLRTSMIGRELVRDSGLLEWFLSRRGTQIRGYRRAVFSGFTTQVLAELLADLIDRHADIAGLYHISAAPIDKYDLLTRIARRCDIDIDIQPYDDFVCDRSLDSSVLRALADLTPPSWDEMIDRLGDEMDLYDPWRDAR